MKQSHLFSKTKKEISKDIEINSHKLLIKADLISQVAAGVYGFLPLGWRAYKKIENIIREEMEKLDAEEIFMPSLVPQNLWLETNRWTTIDPPLFQVKDRHDKIFGLCSTHEEVVTDLVRKRVDSYKNLPFSVFQIQNKFRNEMRSTGGLLRTREFMMKDLYSFHANQEDILKFYQKVKKSYFNIFKKCGLKPFCVEAESGTIGGKISNEFMVESEVGEDRILVCEKCGFGANIEKTGKIKICPECKNILQVKRAIEVGHIFILGTKYSEVMKANFKDKNGQLKPIIMGCYGIGLPRLLSTVIEKNHDEKGIIWPKNLAPFQVHLLALENTSRVKKSADKIYKDLQKAKIEVLYDDRQDKTIGEKLVEADLFGLPYRIVVSERTLCKKCVEIKKRNEKKSKLICPSKINSLRF
ncbi:MAG: proline--tRNA ligase [Patescibacteria group bacterium]